MNYLRYIPFSSPWIMRHHLGNAKTILDVGCGDGVLMLKINQDKKYKVTGVDLYGSYLKTAKKLGVYTKLQAMDITKLKFKENSSDIVLASYVIEHITKEEGIKFLKALENIAKKKVIVTTSVGFIEYHPFEVHDGNPLQIHKSGWEIKEMEKYGYKVFGQGTGFIYRPGGLLYKFRSFKNFWVILSLLLAPFIYSNPKFALGIVAVKKISPRARLLK